MYKYNLTPPYLSDEQKKEIFNPKNLKETLKKLNEKTENQSANDMTELKNRQEKLK